MMKYIYILLLIPAMLLGQENSKIKIEQGVRFTSFSMSTQNGLFGPYSSLQDFYAQSAGIEYLAKLQKGRWRLETDLYGTALLAGNPFEKDTLTGKTSRYESGLVAVDAPEKKVVTIPSILELSYTYKRSRLGVGNFAFDGALLNEEHGRMIPSTFSGVNYSWRKEGWKFSGAAIWAIAARSTSGFKSVGESLAQYNPGLDTSGFVHDKSQVNAPIVGVAKVEKVHWLSSFYGDFGSEVYAIPGVFGTVVLNEKLSKGPSLIHLQYIYQYKLGNGGNDDPELAYFQQDRSQYFGFKYGHRVNSVNYFFATSYIDGKGKLLFPREWGRETIVTFQGRERVEGMGKTLAVVAGATGNWTQGKVKHKGGISTGIYVRPEPSDFVFNKYAMPSDQQTNLWWSQHWKGQHMLKTLLVLKVPLSSMPISAGQTINKVDMLNINVIYRYTLIS